MITTLERGAPPQPAPKPTGPTHPTPTHPPSRVMLGAGPDGGDGPWAPRPGPDPRPKVAAA